MCPSGRAKIRILFVYYQLSSFVRCDLEILRRHFDVKELRIPTFRNPLNILKLLLWIARVDLVYTWFAGTNAFFATLFSMLLRKKSLVVVGGYEVAYVPEINYGSLLSPLERVKVKFVLRHASIVLPVSSSTAMEMLRVAKPKRFEIVYNGVDVERFKPLGKKEDLVITVANITKSTIKKKGLEVFVKTAAFLPQIRFVLIGKYDNSVQQLRRITSYNVVFTGYLFGETLLNYYRRAKVYCQLSAHESFGVALAEAMACGCVPVVTKRYALPEVVGDAGFYVPYNNPKATAEAIKKALESDMGEKARERVQRFALKVREEKLVEEITSLTEKFYSFPEALPTKIDVIMITKNSLKPCLKECIDSVFQNIPLNKLIVVDSNSTDGTIDLIRKYGNNKKILIIQKDCKRGEAREIGIREVETAWLAFVDSDVILSKNWFQKIKRYIGPRVGAIEGNVKTPLGIVQRIRPTGRAYTNCTLIKTSLVKDIKIPKEMSVYEDQFIRRWIERKGFKWLKVSDPCSIHVSTSDRVKDAFEIGRMSGKYKLTPFWAHLLSFAIVFVKKLLGKTTEPLEIYSNTIKGYIKGVLERGMMKYERSRDV